MKIIRFTIILLLAASVAFAQRRSTPAKTESTLSKTSVGGLKFRNIGPALTSGRISDFAMNPENPKEYYVASSAGGVWKTINSGTTYEPIFDGQGSYSIGCITMDPNNSDVIWVGTGENNNQRSVSYGDGVYKSEDGGRSWKNMGLKNSEHIGKILVDPRNSNVVYVAAIGPLWSSGGDRGLYKTTDGGNTWSAVLTVDEHTGANDVIMDPRNPDVLYVSTLQRRRHVFTYIGGGPGSGLQRSTDGGATWTKINSGLPSGDLGRIGLAISPANPDILYAIVEAANGGGFYRSTNKGASWEKRNGFSTSGNYYQEIIADPNHEGRVYAMNNWMQVTDDGGKSFRIVGEDYKHIDNHCMWIDPRDSDHFLVGCDGGVYETWDAAKTWQFKTNLPVTQFYKVALDNAEPFYNVYGGTQDNFSLGGPSRTISGHGITNDDWFITNGGDGFESQVDPENPNVVYAQSQHGGLVRFDRLSGEAIGIQPHEREGENSYIWNWDAPLVISKHKNTRIYFAANKVFRSDNRGESWEVISDDLTAKIDRNKLKVMGRVWGIDAVAKNGSTSQYGAVVALDESPLNENLIIAGTDDGLIQVTSDGGQNWRRAGSAPGVPERTYVNMVLASNHDENVIYACFNRHKEGDFRPFVYKSTDKGATWTSITNNLPARGSSYSIAEDHVDRNLLFVGTEFGVFFSNNGGAEWKQLKSGLPTIAVRDLAIQQRENDLVLGTFGRGFFVLDDYSSLRNLSDATLAKEAELFSIRDALAFEYSYKLGLPGKAFQGDDYYTADNLGAEAILTYYLKDDIKTLEDLRKEREKKIRESGGDVNYPSYEELKAERDQEKPYLLFTIKDAAGNIVRKLTTNPRKGINRINWDLRDATKGPISFGSSSFYNPFAGVDQGTLVAPGTYSVTLSKSVDGNITQIAGPVNFNVKALKDYSVPAADRVALAAFQNEVTDAAARLQGAQRTIGELNNQMRHIREAIKRAKVPQEGMMADVLKMEKEISEIQLEMNGDRTASILDIDRPPTVSNRIYGVQYQIFYSTSGPTKMHKDSFEIAKKQLGPIITRIQKLVTTDLKNLEDKLNKAGAPYTPYRIPTMQEN